jgi:uncharacterized protein with FMN-binding domain
MKKIFLSFTLIVAFALFATFARRNVGVGADRFLSPSLAVIGNADTNQTSVPATTNTKSKDANEQAVSQPSSIQNTIRRAFEDEDDEDDDRPRRVGSQNTTVPSSTAAPVTTTKTQTQTTTTGKYKNGTYTGNVADAYYGNVEVKAIITNGKISDVVFLQYPNDRSTSIEINTQAMPLLKSEAIQAQSASVNIVSGATETSGAFKESLANALSQATI